VPPQKGSEFDWIRQVLLEKVGAFEPGEVFKPINVSIARDGNPGPKSDRVDGENNATIVLRIAMGSIPACDQFANWVEVDQSLGKNCTGLGKVRSERVVRWERKSFANSLPGSG
jgi:hypothetical protein